MAADHSVLCSALPVSLYHIRMLSALRLVSILIVKLLLSRANTLSHFALSLSVAPRVTSRVTHTSLYNENYSRLPGNSLDINIFVYFLLCCTHTHTYTDTHSLIYSHTPVCLLPINFCCLFLLSSLCAHDASSRRRCLLAHVLRLSLCVCVCSLFAAIVVVASSSLSLRLLRGCFVVVVVARVVVVCKVVCVQISTLFEGRPLPILRSYALSLSLIRVLSRVLRALSCLILVAGWRLE